jgi:hypothetical protein
LKYTQIIIDSQKRRVIYSNIEKKYHLDEQS